MTDGMRDQCNSRSEGVNLKDVIDITDLMDLIHLAGQILTASAKPRHRGTVGTPTTSSQPQTSRQQA